MKVLHINSNRVQLKMASNTRLVQIQPRLPNKIIIPTNKGYHVIDKRNIIALSANGGYTHIYFNTNETIFSSNGLKKMEQLLPNTMFFKIHQSHVIKLDQVKMIGFDHIIMENGMNLPVARRRRKGLLKLFGNK